MPRGYLKHCHPNEAGKCQTRGGSSKKKIKSVDDIIASKLDTRKCTKKLWTPHYRHAEQRAFRRQHTKWINDNDDDNVTAMDHDWDLFEEQLHVDDQHNVKTGGGMLHLL